MQGAGPARALLPIALFGWGAAPAGAQESTNYRLDEHARNAGGCPVEGKVLSTGNYRLSLGALGDPASGAATIQSPSYRAEVGFVAWYPPPGEVLDLRFLDRQTMAWHPERSVGGYDLYRGLASGLPGGYGSCLETGLPVATATDASVPPSGQSYIYLPTAENRLGEEGTMGVDSASVTRLNGSPCP
jgi:hypothetical protein